MEKNNIEEDNVEATNNIDNKNCNRYNSADKINRNKIKDSEIRDELYKLNTLLSGIYVEYYANRLVMRRRDLKRKVVNNELYIGTKSQILGFIKAMIGVYSFGKSVTNSIDKPAT